MRKIGAVIVTYNPDIDILKENILSIVRQVDLVKIVDNNSNNKKEIFLLCNNKFGNKVSYLFLDQNYGIGFAQNKGIASFNEQGFDWVMMLDQDSVVDNNVIYKMTQCDVFNDSKTAIISMPYRDHNMTIEQQKKRVASLEPYVKKDKVIASGNLINIKAWDYVGGFDESLFIDQVDFDFDARLILSGYDIWQLNSVELKHSLGEVIHNPLLEKLLLIPKHSVVTEHPAFREYFVYRNTLIYAKRYPQLASYPLILLKSFLLLRTVCMYRSDKKGKFRAALKGIKDGMAYSPKKDKKFNELMERIGKSEENK